MAEITHHHAATTTAQTSTSTTYENKGTAITLDASSTYIVFASAQVNGSNAGALSLHCRVLINSAEATGSEKIMEPASGTAGQTETYFYMQKVTTGGSTEAVQFQLETTSGDTARADSIVLFAMKLDDLPASAWAFAEDDDTAGPTQHTTTMADFASITFTPGEASDWLVVGNGSVLVDNVNVNTEYQINSAGDVTDTAPFMSQEGEDTGETMMWVLQRVFSLTNQSNTFKIQGRDDATGVNDHNRSAIFALNLNAFAQHSSVWTETEYNSVAIDTWEEIHDLAFTPDTASQNWVAFVCMASDSSSKAGEFYRLQLGGVDVPAGFGSNTSFQQYDASDERSGGGVHYLGSLAASLQDLDIDFQTGNTNNNVEDRSVAIFSLELAAAGGATPKGPFDNPFAGPFGGPLNA